LKTVNKITNFPFKENITHILLEVVKHRVFQHYRNQNLKSTKVNMNYKQIFQTVSLNIVIYSPEVSEYYLPRVNNHDIQ